MRRQRRLRLLVGSLLVTSSVAAQPRPASRAKPPDRGGATAKPNRIKATVVDVAGGRAYVEPGSKAGLRVGDTLEIGGRRYSVVGVSASHAVLELGKLTVPVGATGHATLDPDRAPPRIEPLPEPTPLAAYRSLWPRLAPPASSQKPRRIPIGPVSRPERSRVEAGLAAYGVVPTEGAGPAWLHGELRSALHYEPLSEAPFALDADVAAGAWLGADFRQRPGSDSRPLTRVRALQAAYGSEAAFLAALGRLRYASSTLGSLDGVRLRAPLVGGLGLGAFGGFVANPLSGAPSSEAARFGGELVWEDDGAAWRPRAVVGGHVSRYQGELDERRVNVLFDLNPAFGRFGAHAEVGFFDEQNPWNAEPAELSAAGADVALRIGRLDVGGRVAMERPDRSRYLASFLPPDWLCLRRPTGAAVEPCIGGDARYVAGLDVGLGLDGVRLSAGITGSRTEHLDLEQLAGHGTLRLLELAGPLRLDAGFFGSRGTLLESAALEVSPGVELMDGDGDVALRYRPALLRYRASTRAILEHSVGGALWLSPTPALNLSVDADFVTGDDVDAVLVQSALVWRTGF